MKDSSFAVEHQRCQDMLPWLINGTLPNDQQLELERHLTSCAQCARDLEVEREVHAQLGTGDAVLIAPQSGWQKMSARLDAPRVRAARDGLGTPWRWAMAAQTVLIVGLATGWGIREWRNEAAWAANVAPRYETLSSSVPSVSKGSLRVVFSDKVAVGEVNELLSRLSLQVMSGPSEAGVYTLSATAASADIGALLRSLRMDQRVVFAEPVSALGP
jgi:hypothetical protein